MSFKHLEECKSESYKKNDELEDLLTELNDYLKVISNDAAENTVNIKQARHPILFIVGVPRSGTTLLTQWLASIGEFCYPSNLISRFYEAPFFGAIVQELLFNEKYDYKGELNLEGHDISFKSDVGKTKGILEPHEFWYFWRRFFDFPDIPINMEEFERKADFSGFIQAINQFQAVFDKPSFFKALIINPYIKAFANALPNALFIHIQRDPVANMQSLLKTRRKYFEDESVWFSFKPIEFKNLKDNNPKQQVAGQVYYLNKLIMKQLENVPLENKLIVNYDKFCLEPSKTYELLSKKLNRLGYKISKEYTLGNEFIDYSAPSTKGNEELKLEWEKMTNG